MIENNEACKYEDIINMPHPISKNHKQMSLNERAAQFSAFAALTGHSEAIKETARLTDKELELDENVIDKLNSKLCIIGKNLGKNIVFSITYFVPDIQKNGGKYVTVSGCVKKIDEYERTLVMEDKTIIKIERINKIDSEIFDKDLD